MCVVVLCLCIFSNVRSSVEECHCIGRSEACCLLVDVVCSSGGWRISVYAVWLFIVFV